MKVDRTPFGQTSPGQQIELITLNNERGLEISLTNFGATLTRLYFPDKTGLSANLVLGYTDLEGILNDTNNFGATIGRYANRIAGGRFKLEGKNYQLACNSGDLHLHGGNEGFNKKIWRVDETSDCSVTFCYDSSNGEEGYPGNLAIRVTYSLSENNELVIEYRGTADQATPVNLTNHAYWNLAGSGEGDILSHLLTLHCDHYLPVDNKLIPTGEIADVERTPLDFRALHAIGERIKETGAGYDHCFVQSQQVRKEPEEIAKVEDPASGRVMTIATTEPGIQFYTGNLLRDVQGIDGQIYGKHGAFCLEAQHFPDSPNRPNFPSSILMPGDNYYQKTIHRFSINK